MTVLQCDNLKADEQLVVREQCQTLMSLKRLGCGLDSTVCTGTVLGQVYFAHNSCTSYYRQVRYCYTRYCSHGVENGYLYDSV